MFTVALIGPDGAGKTTVSRHLMGKLPVPTKYLYMGVNSDSSNRMLPTTSLIRAVKRACGAAPDVSGPRDRESLQQKPRGPLKRFARSVKSLLSLLNRVSDEWYRQSLAWFYQWRGYIVLYDRHYFVDYYAYDIAQSDLHRPMARRIHGFLLNRVYPRPDLVVYLDAPSEVLFARKGEGTLETLERRRRDYLELREHVKHFAVVDATQPAEDVATHVQEIITNYYGKHVRSARRRQVNGNGNGVQVSASAAQEPKP